ncbi:MAG: methylase, partial [Selenomonadaceae bacterium]|nr:methylase [Selenomonadaceae bacterium]
KVRESRLQSPKAATRKAADKPTLFTEIRQPDSDYLCVPLVTSSARKYIPIGWVSKDVIASNLCSVIPNATLWLFGQLESIVHMAWMRAVGGRLGNGYRYSAEIVYNNFVFINADKKRLARIEKAAQKILDARAKFPNASLADLYDEVSMPYELRQAHAENDAAVMDAYGYPPNFSELQIVTDLLYRYQAMLTKIPESMVAATSRRNFDA